MDNRDPDNPQVVMMSRTKFLRQYFKLIRPGAERIGVRSVDPSFDPVAFIHVGGSAVAVVKADKGGPFTVRGLPSATYGIDYTTCRHTTSMLRTSSFDREICCPPAFRRKES